MKIDKTAFEARITNNHFDQLANVAGLFQESAANADCPAGLLVVRNGKVPCEGFAGVYNENTWYMNAATSDATMDTVVFACNTYDNKMADGYFIGTETLGLDVPAGRYGNFTRINFDGESVYRFGEGNIDGTVGEKKYFTIDDGLLKPATAAPTTQGSIYFELRETGNFVEGAGNSFGYYDVVACKVSVVAGA